MTTAPIQPAPLGEAPMPPSDTDPYAELLVVIRDTIRVLADVASALANARLETERQGTEVRASLSQHSAADDQVTSAVYDLTKSIGQFLAVAQAHESEITILRRKRAEAEAEAAQAQASVTSAAARIGAVIASKPAIAVWSALAAGLASWAMS